MSRSWVLSTLTPRCTFPTFGQPNAPSDWSLRSLVEPDEEQREAECWSRHLTPEHKAIQAATRHDYLGFAAEELPHRDEFKYPPFGFQARVVIRCELESKAEQMADHIAEQIEFASEKLAVEVSVLGPAPAPVEKLRGKFRFHMLLSSESPGALQSVVQLAQKTIRSINDVQWIVDIDPQDMM